MTTEIALADITPASLEAIDWLWIADPTGAGWPIWRSTLPMAELRHRQARNVLVKVPALEPADIAHVLTRLAEADPRSIGKLFATRPVRREHPKFNK